MNDDKFQINGRNKRFVEPVEGVISYQLFKRLQKKFQYLQKGEKKSNGEYEYVV